MLQRFGIKCFRSAWARIFENLPLTVTGMLSLRKISNNLKNRTNDKIY